MQLALIQSYCPQMLKRVLQCTRETAVPHLGIQSAPADLWASYHTAPAYTPDKREDPLLPEHTPEPPSACPLFPSLRALLSHLHPPFELVLTPHGASPEPFNQTGFHSSVSSSQHRGFCYSRAIIFSPLTAVLSFSLPAWSSLRVIMCIHHRCLLALCHMLGDTE